MIRNLTVWFFLAAISPSWSLAESGRSQDSMPEAGRALQLNSYTQTAPTTPTPGLTPENSDLSQLTGVARRPYIKETDRHPMVSGYIMAFQTNHLARLTKKRDTWMPQFRLIDRVLAEYEIPLELKYLCVIESELTTTAISRKGATGPWQFMPETARAMGLKVGRGRDERYDLFKSTHAAARMLNRMYDEFGDWLLVVAAYNAGPGRVHAAMKKANTTDFWKLQYELPAETRNHVKKFMAMRHVMDELLTPEVERSQRMAEAKQQIDSAGLAGTHTEALSGRFHSLIIAKNLSMDIGYFNALNPDFDQKVGSEGYMLRLPEVLMTQFNAKKIQILAESVHFLLTSNPIDRERLPNTIELPGSPGLKTDQSIRLRP